MSVVNIPRSDAIVSNPRSPHFLIIRTACFPEEQKRKQREKGLGLEESLKSLPINSVFKKSYLKGHEWNVAIKGMKTKVKTLHRMPYYHFKCHRYQGAQPPLKCQNCSAYMTSDSKSYWTFWKPWPLCSVTKTSFCKTPLTRTKLSSGQEMWLWLRQTSISFPFSLPPPLQVRGLPCSLTGFIENMATLIHKRGKEKPCAVYPDIKILMLSVIFTGDVFLCYNFNLFHNFYNNV